jgi:hypothetical protein
MVSCPHVSEARTGRWPWLPRVCAESGYRGGFSGFASFVALQASPLPQQSAAL